MTLRACIKCTRAMYDTPFEIRENGVCFYCQPEDAHDVAIWWALLWLAKGRARVPDQYTALCSKWPELPRLADEQYIRIRAEREAEDE